MKLALTCSASDKAQAALVMIQNKYSWVAPEEADVIVALGGDGFMLDTLHDMLDSGKHTPVFGMNLGTVGFLMNEWHIDNLIERIQGAKRITIPPLCMTTTLIDGTTSRIHAVNEVSLFRQARQTANIEVSVDGRVVIENLMCDGVMVATPAGSTAYNLSVRGPILPLNSNMLALTPISPFRPRRWTGAIVADQTCIGFRVLDHKKRPVSATGDMREIRDVSEVQVTIDRSRCLNLLFDPERALDDRITLEQFS